MNQQLQVGISFSANTNAARSNISELSNLLSDISSQSHVSIDSGPITTATNAARELQMHLEAAVNVNTGQLNLDKFNASLSKAGTTLTQLTTDLQGAGPKGQQAFLKIAKAISSAETPMVQLNSHLANFMTTLANTTKWQIASTMIHGIQGSIQGAISYAKDLNKALTDIQIVTGQSDVAMSKFAATAGEAATRLNTTTLEYSKAALIFYQQGLTGDAVEKRTDTVIRLAQVTGQSADMVSSQMTAIWNNFAKGSSNLEHYADVITKLGATTASSSSEIAAGMEKFAPIANTVGLSYEKAAASVATVVAETRQSAEVVGTAFKTMFARIEGLKLGETLEDGVDLNKYSEALKTVGVNILDSNGELKQMDTILDAIGDKWQGLGQEQKVALAQSVAGVRQYSQFMALMENYDKVLKNEETATSKSDGELKKQADVWAKSWEGASARAQEAKNKLYQSIIDDKTLITIENLFTDLIKGINNLSSAFGGIGPMVLSLVGMFSKTLFPLISNGLRQIGDSIAMRTGKAAADFATMQGALSADLEDLLAKDSRMSEAEKEKIRLNQQLIDQKALLTLNSKTMTEAQKAEAQAKMAMLEAQAAQIEGYLDEQIAAEKALKALMNLSDAEEAYKMSAATTKIEGGYSEDVKQEAVARGSNTYETENNISSTEAKLEDTKASTSLADRSAAKDAALSSINAQIDELDNRSDFANEEDMNKVLEQLEELKAKREEIAATEISVFPTEEITELEDILERERQILEVQQQINEGAEDVSTSTSVGKIDAGEAASSSYTDEKGQQQQTKVASALSDMAPTTTDEAGNTGVAEEDQGKIEASIENYRTLSGVIMDVKLAQQDLNEISNEAGVIGDKLANTNVKEIQSMQNKVKQAKAELDSKTKIANASRKQVQSLSDEIKLMKKSGASTKDIAKKEQQLLKVKKDLKKKTEEQRNAQTKLNKANVALVGSTSKEQRAFASMDTKIQELNKTVGFSEGAMKRYDDAVKKISSSENVTEADIKELQAAIDALGKEAGGTEGELKQLAGQMENALTANGVGAEHLKAINSEMQKTRQAAHDAAEGTEELGRKQAELGNNADSTKKTLTTLTTTVGQVSAAYASLKNFTNVWSDEDATVMDKVIAAMTTMSTLVPLLTTLFGGLKIAKAAENAEEEKGIVISMKSMVQKGKELALGAIETIKTWAQTAAEVAKNIAKGPVGWAIAAASIAMIAAACIALGQETDATNESTEAYKKQNEAKKEAAEATKDAADEWQEQQNTMDGLIKSYKDLKTAGEDITDAQKAILDQTPDLIDSYKGLSTEIRGAGDEYEAQADKIDELIAQMENAAAAGDVERVIQLRTQIDQESAKATAATLKDGANATMGDVKDALKESGTVDQKNDGSYKMNIDGWGSEEQTAIDAFKKATAGVIDSEQDSHWGDNGLTFDLDTSDSDKFVTQYQALLDAKKQMEEDMDEDELEDSGVYEDLCKMLDESEEAYKATKEKVDDANQYKIENLAASIDLTSIESYDDYMTKIDNLRKTALEEEKKKYNWDELSAEKQKEITDQVNAQVDAWAETNDLTKDYVALTKKMSYAEENFGKSAGKKVKEATEAVAKKGADARKLKENKEEWNKLSDEKKAELESDIQREKLLLEVDYSKVTNDEMLKAELDRLQAEADKTEIKTNITGVQSAKSALKEDGMTEKDWETIKTSINWDEMGIEYTDFLRMSYDEQKAFLEKTEQDWNATYGTAITENLDQANESLENLNQAAEDADAELASAQATYETFKAMGADTSGITAIIQEKQAIADAAHAAADAQQENVEALEAEREQYRQAQEEQLKQCETLDALDAAFEKMSQDGTASSNAYYEALTNLGSQYENAKTETEEFESALSTLGEAQSKVNELQEQGITTGAEYEAATAELAAATEQLAEKEDALRASILAGEAGDKYGLDPDIIEAQAKAIRKVNSDLGMSAEQATKLAIANQRMNAGIKTLNENFANWKETLQTAEKTSKDYAEAVAETTNAMKDLLAVSDEWELPDEFLDSAEHLEWLEQAANGDEIAINKLGLACAAAQVDVAELDHTIVDAYNAAHKAEKGFAAITEESFSRAQDAVAQGIQNIQNNLDSLINGTMTLDEAMGGTTDSWISSLNEMALATGMSVDEMNDMLNQVGVTAKVETISVPKRVEVPTYDEYTEWVQSGTTPITYETVDEKGNKKTETAKKPNYVKRTYTVPGPTYTVDGYEQVAQISTEENPKTASISSSTAPVASYTGVGGTANRGSTNRGGGVSSSSIASSSSDSGSSDSGSEKSKETKDKKNSKDEIERYHVIKAQIESTSKLLEKLSAAKDRAWGPNKVRAMNQEIAAQQRYIDQQRRYIKEIEAYAAKDKAGIASYGAQFDRDGNIINYDQIMQHQIDLYNQAVEAYNNSAQEDADKTRLEQAEKVFNDFKEKLSQYEETNTLLQEQRKALDDKLRDTYDLITEKNDYVIQLQIEVDDSKLKWLEYIDKKIDHYNDGLDAISEKIGNLNDKGIATLDQSAARQQGIKQVLQHHLQEGYMYDNEGNILRDANGKEIKTKDYAKSKGINTNQLLSKYMNGQSLSDEELKIIGAMSSNDKEKIQGYTEGLETDFDSMVALIEEAINDLSEAFTQMGEEMDKATKPLQRAQHVVENCENIIGIVGKDILGVTDDLMDQLYDEKINAAHAMTENANAKVQLYEANLAKTEDEYKKWLDKYNRTKNDEDKAIMLQYKKLMEEQQDALQEAIEARDQLLEEELNRVVEKYENTIQRFKKDMLDAFAGEELTWNQLKDQWDYVQKAAARYVPEYKQIYELSKLTRDINKKIDETDNLRSKQALRDLMMEINQLGEEGVQVSQYDLDNARKRYDLEVARLALEETRNTKSTVTLSKDTEGNWSYVYTASQDDVAKAEQTYEDKLYAMQEANAKYINELQQKIMDCEEQYAEKLAEIMTNQELSAQQREAALKELEAWFTEEMAFLTDEAEKAVNNNARLYEEDVTWYVNYLTQKQGTDQAQTEFIRQQLYTRLTDQNKYIKDWGDTFLGMATGLTRFQDYQSAITKAATEGTGKMNNAYATMKTKVDGALRTIGTSAANFSNTMTNALKTANTRSGELSTTSQNLSKDLATNYGEMSKSVSSFVTNYSTNMDKIVKVNDNLIGSYNRLMQAMVNAAKIENGTEWTNWYVNPYENQSNQNGSNNYSGSGGGGGSASKARIQEVYDLINTGQVGNAPYRWENLRSLGYSDEEIELGQQLINYLYPGYLGGYGYSEAQAWNLLGFATGGYTGKWSTDTNGGKLAILHEKELVLNESDTENMLKSIDLLHSIVNTIDLNAKSTEYSLNNLKAVTTKNLEAQQLDQTVTISAEFPSVSDRNEIEEAFKMLVNEASQYANRKNF